MSYSPFKATAHLALPPEVINAKRRRHSFTYEPAPSRLHTDSSSGSSAASSPSKAPSVVHHSHSDESYNEMPLSMRFMHKPSRSKELLEKATDPTRQNSLLNSHLGDSYPPINTSIEQNQSLTSSPVEQNNNSNIDNINNDSSAVVDGPGSPSGPNSPADVTNSPSNDKYKLVRKKSGELVKPSLKDPNATYFNKKRSQSLPTTPTYKQVHFGGDNDVRYFKKKDRPTAISASNSPTLEGAEILVKRINLDSEEETDDDSTDDYYDDEGEDGDELNGHYSKYRHHHRHNNPDEDDEEYNNFNLNSTGSTKYPRAKAIRNIDWQLKLLNFPPLSYDTRIKREVPVFLERLFISVDKKYLLGHIAVKNVAFEKYLTVRYSLDNWMTIIEIPSLYAPDRPDILKKNNYDRFIFQVPLENLFDSFRLSTSSSESSDSSDNNDSNSEKSQEKVYQLCIKYVANNVDFWDNNGFKNYVIKLIKTIKTPGSVASAIKFNPKIQDHAKKPKYSSSYLKRIVSDSQIELKGNQKKQQSFVGPEKPATTTTGKKEDPFYVHDNSSSDVNDFVKNNFYMSSPLLSSYNNHASRNVGSSSSTNAYLESTDSLPNRHGEVVPSSPSGYKIKFNQKHGGTLPNFSSPKPAFSTGNGEVSPDSSPDVIPQKSRDFLNSKSYKELLDNYCFFSSPSTNDDDMTTSTSSDNFNRLSSPLYSQEKQTKHGNTHPPCSASSTSTTESESTQDKKSYTVSSFLGV